MRARTHVKRTSQLIRAAVAKPIAIRTSEPIRASLLVSLPEGTGLFEVLVIMESRSTSSAILRAVTPPIAPKDVTARSPSFVSERGPPAAKYEAKAVKASRAS